VISKEEVWMVALLLAFSNHDFFPFPERVTRIAVSNEGLRMTDN